MEKTTGLMSTKISQNKLPSIAKTQNFAQLFTNQLKKTKKLTINLKKTKTGVIKSPNADLHKKITKSIKSPPKIIQQGDLARALCLPMMPILAMESKREEQLVVAQAQAGLIGFDEINRLIKKLTLSFSAKKSESSFFIKKGIFEGARFHILCQQNNLYLNVNNLTNAAHQLIKSHQEYLRQRLNRKEINLVSLMFNS